MKLDVTNYTKIKVILFLIIFFYNKKIRNFCKFLLSNFKISKSQVFQDLFVIYFSNKKKFGNFIEIGVGDGKIISNTYMLESKFKWVGILCEPNIYLQKKILKTRNSKLEKKPLSEYSKKKVPFFLNKDPYQSSILKSKNSKIIYLNTISLNHLFEKYKLSKNLDYISIDTEGNEFEILRKFNFKKYNIKIFSIEHNFDTAKRNKIYKLMYKNGYKRVYKFFSYMDDWYIK